MSHCRMRGIQQIDKAWRAINETRSLHVMALPLSEVGDMLPSVGPKPAIRDTINGFKSMEMVIIG